MSDPLFPFLVTLRYMHILGAIALMGGTIFMRFALRPVVVQLPPEERAKLHEAVRTRWSKFVMLASALLLLSGIINLGLASQYKFDRVFGMSYNMIVGIKFLLALPIFFIAAVLAGRSAMAKRWQANAEFWMNLNLTLALVMVLIGGTLKFVGRTPKEKGQPPAAPSAQIDQNASQRLSFVSHTE